MALPQLACGLSCEALPLPLVPLAPRPRCGWSVEALPGKKAVSGLCSGTFVVLECFRCASRARVWSGWAGFCGSLRVFVGG